MSDMPSESKAKRSESRSRAVAVQVWVTNQSVRVLAWPWITTELLTGILS